MGEARRRGSFEERKAQAIKAGRALRTSTINRRGKSMFRDLEALRYLSSMLAPLRVR